MAELLLYAKSTKTDPFDPPLGAVIAARENGFEWGIRESIEAWVAAGNSAATFPTDFVILKLPNVSHLGKVKEYVEQHQEYNFALQKHTHQYKWQIPVDILPPALKTELIASRIASRTYTINQIKAYVKNKISGAFEA